MTLDKEQIKQKRKRLLQDSKTTTVINKGDKRIVSATRICAICNRPLSKMNLTDGSTFAIVSHYSCKLSELVRVNLCKDIRSCYSQLED